jgi:hypothetical protein
VDYKCAMALKDAYVAERLAGYDKSWQMAHYLWMASEAYREKVSTAYIALVRIEPWKIFPLHPVSFHEDILKRWADSAWATWEQMATPPITGPIQRWDACTTKYGPCEFTGACWDAALDREVMALDYVRIPKEESPV